MARRTDLANLRASLHQPQAVVHAAAHSPESLPRALPMNESVLFHESTVNGLRAVLLENRFLRITVLPEAGARIWQITYKPFQADLLWNHPEMPPSCQPLRASYDDNWTGGWDELFPNDETGHIDGTAYPDHGELWSGAWTHSLRNAAGAAEAHFTFITPLSGFHAEKTLILRPASHVLEVRYRLTNTSARTLPFLWKLHPAFAVSPAHRIDFPTMRVVLEPAFLGTLEDAPLVFDWPFADRGESIVDLRQVPDTSSRAVHFFYGTELGAGWCGITNRANGLAAALLFDPAVFSSCWLFATHGGWKGHNVAVLEPATGYPFTMQSMIDSGRARTLAPAESLETTVLLSLRPGMRSIGGVQPDGTILAGSEAG